ncbi:pyridoxal phosphate-dependent transferase [Cadophora sp. MPI-SDFR-AT-0126]|nr:pyridoxal phosphate-dependent transferase [Leotiomycetes sp. MPI-SDFR-AT-0126]
MAFDKVAFWSRVSSTLMNTGAPFFPAVITRAKGTFLYDVDDNAMLDFTSGQMSSLLGHSHPEIVEVVSKYIRELDHLMSQMVSLPVVQLAEDLSRILPRPLEKSFFLSTGSESVEAAIKMAKCATGKFEVVAFSASYHGVTQGVASATYSLGRRTGIPVMPGQFSFPAPNAYRSVFRKRDGSYDWETEMEFGWSMIDAQSVGSLAAFVFEPILSVGGILEPPVGYMQRLAMECKKRGMLLIADESQTGLGRTGYMFAFQRDNIVPDIVTLSKTIGCGLPVASVSTTPEIEQLALEGGYLWVTTHYNDPLAAAVGSKVIEIALRDDICKMARDRGKQLREGLERLQEKYWCIGDIRGRGLLQGVEIISDPVTRAPGVELGGAIASQALELGLSCQISALPGSCGVFRIAPPLTVSAEEMDQALSILGQAFAAVCADETAAVTPRL